MRRLLFVLALLILLRAVFSPGPMPAKAMAEAGVAIARGLETFLIAFAKLDLTLHRWMWETLNGPWLVLYGLFKLLIYLLAALGYWLLDELLSVSRFFRR